VDPNRDVQWRQFPADLLGVALARGDIQAFALGDPLGWVIRERDGLREIANNLDGDYQHRACCVLGLRGSLVRNDRPARVLSTLRVDLPYPRHRDDPALVALRRQVLEQLGLPP